MSVLLHEPPKEKVLAWNSGDPITREVDIILIREGLVPEGRIDLAERNVESWKDVKGVQAPIFVSQQFELGDITKSDPQMQAGFAKRGAKDLNHSGVRSTSIWLLLDAENQTSPDGKPLRRKEHSE
jgi:primary-amine oxidase